MSEKVLTPDEVLYNQRKEASAVYAKQVNDLREKINEYQAKLKNVEGLFNEAFSAKIKEVKELEEVLRMKIHETDEAKANLAYLLREAEIKSDNAHQNHIIVTSKSNDLDDRISNHTITSKEDREDIAKRKAECIRMENDAKEKVKLADEKMAIALKKESDIEDKANKLVHIGENINDDIKVQKDLQVKNKILLDAIHKERTDLENLNNKTLFDRQELEQLRSDLDRTTAQLSKRKIEIDTKEQSLRAIEIKNALDLKRIQDAQKNIDYETGKLNELKNNVNALTKKES